MPRLVRRAPGVHVAGPVPATDERREAHGCSRQWLTAALRHGSPTGRPLNTICATSALGCHGGRGFPDHQTVVDAIESVDLVAGTTASARYAYHDGVYDGEDGSFLGFAFVEETDIDVRGEAAPVPGMPMTQASLRRTWFHPGPSVERHRPEGYGDDPELPELPPDRFLDADTLAVADFDEGRRALAGQMIRKSSTRSTGRAHRPRRLSR